MEVERSSNGSTFNDIEIYGYSKQGCGGGKVECQDTYSIIHDLHDNTHFFAVYDGHGERGKDVSLYVNKHVEDSLKKKADKIKHLADQGYVEGFFKDFFNLVDSNLHKSNVDSQNGGSCCNAVFISEGKLYALNVGDSRSVMCRGTQGMELTKDQKPSRPDEGQRVAQMGGIVERASKHSCLRCWDKNKTHGLAMTRTLGDLDTKDAGVIPEPEVFKYDLQPGDKFIIVASDGVWDVMSSQETVNFVLNELSAGTPKQDIPKALALVARKRWEDEGHPNDPYCDDITVVLAYPKAGGTIMGEETSAI